MGNGKERGRGGAGFGWLEKVDKLGDKNVRHSLRIYHRTRVFVLANARMLNG